MAPREKLEESIRHLRGELADGDPLSPEDRALLDRTLEEVAQRLDEDEHDFSLTDSVYEELQELSARIERPRPTLSVLLGRIVDSLSQLGI
jgi:hypothetical protein